jgi:hypothetical protein
MITPRGLLVTALLVGAFLLTIANVKARDDGQYTNSPNKSWFQSLKIPGTQSSCCDLSDCHTVDYDIKGDHYRAFVEGEWVDIPNDKVLNNVGNPVGQGVACYAKYPDTPIRLFCFVPAGGV